MDFKLENINLNEIKTKLKKNKSQTFTRNDSDSPSYCSSCIDKRPSVSSVRWGDSQINLLKCWITDCGNSAKKHSIASLKKRHISNVISFFSILLPTITALLYEYSNVDEIILLLLILDAIVTSISTIKNYELLSQRHGEADLKYKDIALNITLELAKPISKRQKCMEFIQEIKGTLELTDAISPNV